MAGFRSLADRVRDSRVPTEQRRTALRKCLEKFSPYGHRATWHHLCSRAGFGTGDRYPDPALLVAALEELEEARTTWQAYYNGPFAVRRKLEKREGIRQPSALDDWHRQTWGGCGIAWCEDPLVHPSAPLAEVLRRLISALESAPGAVCPVCAGDQLLWRGDVSHPPYRGTVCTDCGILVPRAMLTTQALEQAQALAKAKAKAQWPRRMVLASAA